MPSLRSAPRPKFVVVPSFLESQEASSDHGDEQVIAPLLIILRVANRSALTRETIVSGNIGSIHFKSEEKSADGDWTLPDGNHAMDSTETNGGTPDELGAGGENAIDEVPL
jgi:hypothetical protein